MALGSLVCHEFLAIRNSMFLLNSFFLFSPGRDSSVRGRDPLPIHRCVGKVLQEEEEAGGGEEEQEGGDNKVRFKNKTFLFLREKKPKPC